MPTYRVQVAVAVALTLVGIGVPLLMPSNVAQYVGAACLLIALIIVVAARGGARPAHAIVGRRPMFTLILFLLVGASVGGWHLVLVLLQVWITARN